MSLSFTDWLFFKIVFKFSNVQCSWRFYKYTDVFSLLIVMYKITAFTVLLYNISYFIFIILTNYSYITRVKNWYSI